MQEPGSLSTGLLTLPSEFGVGELIEPDKCRCCAEQQTKANSMNAVKNSPL